MMLISGSFDHEVALNDLRELSSFCGQIRHTRGHTSVVIAIVFLQLLHTRAARASNGPRPLMGKHTHTVTDIPRWKKNGRYK